MKTIDLSAETLTVDDLLRLAQNGSIILRTPQGREFVLTELDDLNHEIAQILKNDEVMHLLAERSKEPGVHSLKQVRKRLTLD